MAALELAVSSNLDVVERFIDGTGKQIPQAVKNAINATGLDVQKAQTLRIFQVFEIRRRLFAMRAVKMKFARKDNLEAQLAIEPPGGKSRADILAKFEKGGTKRPRGEHIAIPQAARRGKSGIVTRSNRPKAFGLRREGGVIRGRKRTFVIRGVGIFQRVGRGRGRSILRLLYSFHRRARIRPMLRFVATAVKVVSRVFDAHMHREFARALRTARR